MTTPTPEAATDEAPEVRNNVDESRYELWVEGQKAGHVDYRDRDGARVFTHAEVGDEWGGRGLGSILATEALDDTIEEGLAIVPRCPFIVHHVEKNAVYADHVRE